MPNYRYFCKKSNPYMGHYMGRAGEFFQCIRIPNGDPRIPEVLEQYKPSWDVFVNYPHVPNNKEEVFRLQTHFRAFGTKFEIEHK